MKVAFISGPYRAETQEKIRENILAAAEVAARYWINGYAVICPHMNTAFFDGICPDETWLRGDIEILKRCDVIVMMKTWKDSKGALDEYWEAGHIGLEVIYD